MIFITTRTDFYLLLSTFALLLKLSDAWGGGHGGFGGGHGGFGGWGGGGHGGWGGGQGGFHSGYGHQGYGYGSGICAGARQRPVGGGFYPQQQMSRPQSAGFNNNGDLYNSMTMDPMEQQDPMGMPPRKTNFDYRINLPVNRTVVPVTCSLPKTRDISVFDQKCIFPAESTQELCPSRGTAVPTGTTATTSCKSPEYISDNGVMMLEMCKDGKWHGDGNTLTCKSNVVVTQPPRVIPSPYLSKDNVVQYVQQPKVSEQSVPSSSNIIQTPVQYNNDKYQQPYWTYDQKQPVQKQPSPPIITQSIEPAIVPVVSDVKPSPPYNWENDQSRIPVVKSVNYAPKSQPLPTTTTTTTTTTTKTTTTQRPYYLEEKIDWRQYTKPDTPISTIPATNNSYDFIKEMNNNGVLQIKELKCPPLIPKPGMILECLSKSTKNPATGSGYMLSFSNCEESQPIGTEGTYKCQMYFESANGLTTQYRKCKENGAWSGNDDFSCRLECGKSNPGGRLPLITFGEMTILGQWPWHASLFIRGGDDNFDNVCGGTLVSSRAVLTAAHCVTLHLSSLLRDLNDVRVDLGRYYRDKDDPYVQKFKVEKIVIHSAYNPYIFESDIAIIILKEEARIGFHVRPICFPKAQNAAFDEMQLSDGSHATVVGFGVDENGESPNELRSAKIKIIGYRECIESFEEADTGALLAKSTTFCAGNKNGTNVCRGDSGSGAYFAVRTSTGSTSWNLQGMVSLGINISADDKKCDPEKVSIFTRVSPYADWIVRVMSENDAM